MRRLNLLRSNPTSWIVAIGFLVLMVLGSRSRAGVLDDIGYSRLIEEIGESLPTGDGMSVVQSEASFNDGFYPDENFGQFVGKDFIQGSSGDRILSTHAKNVGRRLYGSIDSVAPNTSTVINYSADGWLNNDVLRSQTPLFPRQIDAQVTNHSWVNGEESPDPISRNVLQRMDWMAERDDIIHIAGVGNDATVFNQFAGGFNLLAVGRSSGGHAQGTLDLENQFLEDKVYVDGRIRPHLVAPGSSFTSFTAPLVGGAAVMLLDFSQRQPDLSNGSFLTSVNRNNRVIQNGETSEVIRAVLMAGANRRAITEFDNGDTYLIDTNNGLSAEYGAGQLDIFQSYHILAGGEQDSATAGNEQDIGLYGFDYEPAFDTSGESVYPFSIGEVSRTLAASLVWNIEVELRLEGNIRVGFTDLRDLNLTLYDVSSGERVEVVASDTSIDTTENIYLPEELGAGDYELVVAGEGTSPIDYGLAWRFNPNDPLLGDVNLDGVVGVADLTVISKNMGQDSRALWTDGELNGDGIINEIDFRLLASQYGQFSDAPAGSSVPSLPGGGPVSVSSPGGVVPEPSSLLLLVLGALGLLAKLFTSRRPTNSP